MALNKTIITKIRTKTEDEPEVGDFLISLLQFESETPGWWKATYKTILENTCKGETKSANN